MKRTRYANKSEEAFHLNLLERFPNIRVIPNKELVDPKTKIVLEIDYIIFTERKIFVVDLKATTADEIRGDQEEVLYIFTRYSRSERLIIHNTSTKAKKIRSRLIEGLRKNFTVLPKIVYGNPIKKKEPNLVLDSDSRLISFTLTEFLEFLESEQKNPISDKMIEAYEFLTANLKGIKRELPEIITLKDARNNILQLRRNTNTNLYEFPESISDELILPLSISCENESKLHVDLNRLYEVFKNIEANIYSLLGNISISTSGKDSDVMLSIITNTLNAFAERKIKFNMEYYVPINYHEFHDLQKLPLIDRETECKEFQKLLKSEHQFILLIGDSGVGKSRLLSEISKNLLEDNIKFFKVNENSQHLIPEIEEDFPGRIIFVAEHWNEKEINHTCFNNYDSRIQFIFECSDFSLITRLEKTIASFEISSVLMNQKDLPEKILTYISDKTGLDNYEISQIFSSSEGKMVLFANLIEHETKKKKDDYTNLTLELKILPEIVDLSFKKWFSELIEKKIISKNKYGKPEWVYSVSFKEINSSNKLKYNLFNNMNLEKSLVVGPLGSGKTFLSKQIHYEKNQVCIQSGISEKNKFPVFVGIGELKFQQENEYIILQYKDSLKKIVKSSKLDDLGRSALLFILEKYLHDLFNIQKLDTDKSKYYENSLLKIIDKGLAYFIIDGWDELERQDFDLYLSFLECILDKGNEILITCRDDFPYKKSLPKFDEFKQFEIAPLNKKQIQHMIKFKQEDLDIQKILRDKKLQEIDSLLQNPLFLEIISSFTVEELPKTKAELLQRRILTKIYWEEIRKNKLDTIYNFSEILIEFENKYIIVNGNKISLYDLVFGSHKDEEDWGLLSILGEIAYSEIKKEQFKYSYRDVIRNNPITRYFLAKKYYPSGIAYPVINDNHIKDLLIAKKLLNDFSKGVLNDPLNSNILSLLYDHLIVDHTWQRSLLISSIGDNPEDVIFEYCVKYKIEFIPSILVDKKGGPIGGGIRTVMGKTSLGAPQYYNYVQNIVKKKISDGRVSLDKRRKFKKFYLNILRNVPELTRDAIYDRYSGWGEYEYSISIPASSYLEMIIDLFPQYREKENTFLKNKTKKLYKKYLDKCGKCFDQDSCSNYCCSLFRDFLESKKDKIIDVNEIYNENLQFMITAVEKSDDRDLENYCIHVLTQQHLTTHDLFFLIEISTSEKLLMILIQMIRRRLSESVDGELGCVLPPDENLCSSIAKEILRNLIKKDASLVVCTSFFEVLMIYQHDFNIVKWLFTSIQKLARTNVFRELVLTSLNSIIIEPKLNSEMSISLKKQIEDELIDQQSNWLRYLPLYGTRVSLDLPWKKLSVNENLLDEFLCSRIDDYKNKTREHCNSKNIKEYNKKLRKSKYYIEFLEKNVETEEEKIKKEMKNDIFEIEKIKVEKTLDYDVKKIIYSAYTSEHFEFIIEKIRENNLEEDEIQRLIKENSNTRKYLLYHLTMRKNVDILIISIMKFLLFDHSKIYLEKLPGFVKEDIMSDLSETIQESELLQLIQNFIDETRNIDLFKSLRKIVIAENLRIDKLVQVVDIKNRCYFNDNFEGNLLNKATLFEKFMSKEAANNIFEILEKGDFRESDKAATIVFLELSYPFLDEKLKKEIPIFILKHLLHGKHNLQSHLLVCDYLEYLFNNNCYRFILSLIILTKNIHVFKHILEMIEKKVFPENADDRIIYTEMRPLKEEIKSAYKEIIQVISSKYYTIDSKNYAKPSLWLTIIRLSDALKIDEIRKYYTHVLVSSNDSYEFDDILKIIRKSKDKTIITSLIGFLHKMQFLLEDDKRPTESFNKRNLHCTILSLGFLGNKEGLEIINSFYWFFNFDDIALEEILKQFNSKQLRNLNNQILNFEYLNKKKVPEFLKYYDMNILNKRLLETSRYLLLHNYCSELPFFFFEQLIEHLSQNKNLLKDLILVSINHKTITVEELITHNVFEDNQLTLYLLTQLGKRLSVQFFEEIINALLENEKKDEQEDDDIFWFSGESVSIELLYLGKRIYEEFNVRIKKLYEQFSNFNNKYQIALYGCIIGMEEMKEKYNADLENYHEEKGIGYNSDYVGGYPGLLHDYDIQLEKDFIDKDIETD